MDDLNISEKIAPVSTESSKKNNKKKETKPETKTEPEPTVAVDKKDKKAEEISSAADAKKKGAEKPGAKKKGPGAGVSALKEALAKAKEQEEEMQRQ